jgi:hypothetical protein
LVVVVGSGTDENPGLHGVCGLHAVAVCAAVAWNVSGGHGWQSRFAVGVKSLCMNVPSGHIVTLAQMTAVLPPEHVDTKYSMLGVHESHGATVIATAAVPTNVPSVAETSSW